MKYIDSTLSLAAQKRINLLGMPKRNNELWSFFPVNKIPEQHIVTDVAQSPASPQQFQEASQPTERLLPAIEDETDIAALLPLAKSAATMHKIFVENETEMGIIKSRDDFGHSFFEIQKGAKVSLEILDNKVSHDICSERFDIFVDEGADVEIFFANPANDLPLQFRHFNIVQKASSNVRLLNIIQDNKVGRISIDCNLNGENATFDYRSLSLLKGDASKHQRLTIRHNAPNTRSSQFVRNLLDENAYASYDGNVVVGKNCSNVFSSQLVNTILLSESASVSVKPVLKIYHDDVECTHGNTCGELDKEQLFYLTSRGIPEPSARKMLTQAFAAELFTQIPDGPAKTRLLGL